MILFFLVSEDVILLFHVSFSLIDCINFIEYESDTFRLM